MKKVLNVLLVLVVLVSLTGCKDKKEENTTTTTTAKEVETSSTTTTTEATKKEDKTSKKTSKKTTTTTTKKAEPKKEYTCPEGYKLDGTKCTLTKDAKESCAVGDLYKGDCVKGADRVDGIRKCNSMFIEGHDYTVEYFKPTNGPATCAYAPLNNYKDRDSCVNAAPSNPYGWYNGKCYKKVITGNPSFTTTCTGNYKYYTAEDLPKISKNIHNGAGCYGVTAPTYECEDGFTLKDKKCTKTVEATVK